MATVRKKTVLLTLGRLPVALELARGFQAAGWRVTVAEANSVSLCGMSSAVDRCLRVTPPGRSVTQFLDDLAGIVEAEQVDLVVPVSEETAATAALAAVMTPAPRLFCPPRDDVLRLHDKLAFNTLASDTGLAVPATCRGGKIERARFPSAEVVVKPRFSASGRGVRFCRIDELSTLDDSVIVQQRLTGEELSAFGVARSGQLLAKVVYRPRVTSGSVAVCFERLCDARDVEAWIEAFVRRVGHTGFIGIDFIRDDSGRPRAIECNPRATSGLHFLDTSALPAAIEATLEGTGDTDDVEGTADLECRPGRRLAETYSCFTAFLGAIGDREKRRCIWRELRQAQDICWSRRDPLPFLLMTINTWPIIWPALRSGRSFAEVAVEDIEWQAGND